MSLDNKPSAGIYIGALQHLRGKRALLRYPPEESHVLAQFDDTSLTRSGMPVETLEWVDEPHCRFKSLQARENPTRDALGYDWHAFRRDEFEGESEDV